MELSKRALSRVDVKKIHKTRRRKIKECIKRLKRDMVRVDEGHQRIKHAYDQFGVRLEALDSECEKLKEGQEAIALQNSENQKRLDLMFAILRAREQNDFSTADQLVQRLREISK